jgi:hypothetical protein
MSKSIPLLTLMGRWRNGPSDEAEQWKSVTVS